MVNLFCAGFFIVSGFIDIGMTILGDHAGLLDYDGAARIFIGYLLLQSVVDF